MATSTELQNAYTTEDSTNKKKTTTSATGNSTNNVAATTGNTETAAASPATATSTPTASTLSDAAATTKSQYLTEASTAANTGANASAGSADTTASTLASNASATGGKKYGTDDVYVPADVNTNATADDMTLSDYDLKYLSEEEQALAKQYKLDWQAAYAIGDTDGMTKAHDALEDLRSSYYYSGGEDGSKYYSWANTDTEQTYMSEADQALARQYRKAWWDAYLSGDQEGMDTAHANMETLRATYGVTGGEDGSDWQAISKADYANTLPQTYTAGEAPSLSYSDFTTGDTASLIEQQYADNLEAALAGYEGAYNNSIAEIENSESKIPAQYYESERQADADYLQTLRAYLQNAAATGSNSGDAATIAYNSQRMNAVNSLEQSKQEALADLQLQRTQLTNEYQTQIAQAKAENDSEKVAALYQAYQDEYDNLWDEYQIKESLAQAEWESQMQRYTQVQSEQETANEQLITQGWNKLASGITPTDEELTAMGLTTDQAAQYISNNYVSENLQDIVDTALKYGYVDEEGLKSLGYPDDFISYLKNYVVLAGLNLTGTVSSSSGSSSGSSGSSSKSSSSSSSSSSDSDISLTLPSSSSSSSKNTGNYGIYTTGSSSKNTGVTSKSTGTTTGKTTTSTKSSSGSSALKNSSGTTLKKKS